jgi:transcriptional regulator with GAF, ATPase, and Fis domain
LNFKNRGIKVNSLDSSQNILEFLNCLNQQKHIDEMVRFLVQQASALTQSDLSAILMVNPSTYQTIKTLCCNGVKEEDNKYQVLLNQVCGWILLNQLPLITENIQQDTRFHGVSFRGIHVEAAMGAPLAACGNVIGAVIVMNHEGHAAFSTQQLESLQHLAVLAAPYLHQIEGVQRYFQAPMDETTLCAKYAKLGLLGKSKKFIALLQSIEAAAGCDVRVLLEGKSGTGKELIACAIHKLSRRCDFPFVVIECGAIPPNLMESELFGHEKGAFTGALRRRKGLIEEADKGTLFIDEISCLTLDMQAKLMRFLQENEIRPIGCNAPKKVNVRVIAASSQSLKKMIEKGSFREDLYYRLYVYPIQVPPLEERRDDIPMLAAHFLNKYAEEQQKKVHAFEKELLDYLTQRSWPGQIRELENFVQRLVTLLPADQKELSSAFLPKEYKKDFLHLEKQDALSIFKPSLKEMNDDWERKILYQHLIQNNWNQSRTAKELKISEQALRYKMKRLKIDKNVG